MIKIKKRFRITYYLKSGDHYTFTVASFNMKHQGDVITEISWTGGKGVPFHTIIKDISLVVMKQYWTISYG